MEVSMEKRRALAEEILAAKSGGMNVGVYGTEFCQLCGRLRSFEGLITAPPMHPSIKSKRDFVCGECIEAQRASTPEWHEKVYAAMAASAVRFCEFCGEKIDVSGLVTHEGVKVWTCPPCAAKGLHEVALSKLRRRRFVEALLDDADALWAFAMKIARYKVMLDEIHARSARRVAEGQMEVPAKPAESDAGQKPQRRLRRRLLLSNGEVPKHLHPRDEDEGFSVIFSGIG